jgi:hypothetical protein
MIDWESKFVIWSKGPDDKESKRIENTEYQIKAAIAASEKLNKRNISVFTQGSYKNKVNVREDSDIDIGVICYDVFFPEYINDNIKVHYLTIHEDAKYTYVSFKNEIEEALVSHFGREHVSRGKKAFDIKETTHRVSADVVAFFEHRRYFSVEKYISGVAMIPDDFNPLRIINWPEQHYQNGVEKNTIVGRRYKRIVRIMKKLSFEMAENGIDSANKVPSFLIECLCWNVDNSLYKQDTYFNNIRDILIYLYQKTTKDDDCSEWGEVSELKYLFRPSQPWTRQEVNYFIQSAWEYIGYK